MEKINKAKNTGEDADLKHLQLEILQQKSKADDQNKCVHQLSEEVEIHEIQEKISLQSLEDDSNYILNVKLQIDNEKREIDRLKALKVPQ